MFSEECSGVTKVPRMYYTNFDKNITKRYRIIVENWPLKKFISPSDIGTSHELNVLLNAWQSKTTTFRKLEGVEWEEWEREFDDRDSEALERVQELRDRRQERQPSLPSHTGSEPNTLNSSDTSPPEPSTPSSSTSAAPVSVQPQTLTPSITFVNNFSVLGKNGTQVELVSKPRKKRKDAGKPRGSRKKPRENAVSEGQRE